MPSVEAPAKRSRGACASCKRVRRKCDEARPACGRCLSRGVPCAYTTMLQWDIGVASRGKFRHASALATPAVRVQPKGRQRDVAQQLLAQFLTSGHRALFSTKLEEDPLAPFVADLSRRSRAFYHLCVACQAFLSGLSEIFHHFYDVGLASFRSELGESEGDFNEGTLAAGLLLCTVGIIQGTPWTIHIAHLDDLYISRQELIGFRNLSAYTSHAIEVAGIMDMPTFQIGRLLPCRHIWRRFRAHQTEANYLKGGVEPVSGIPRSLLDCFARIEEPDSICSFLLWPGELGEFAQCLLWEAYRLAGVLMALRLHQTPDSTPNPIIQAWSAPDPTILLNQLVAHIESVQRGVSSPAQHELLVDNALLLPVFVAGMHITCMRTWPKWKEVLLNYLDIATTSEKFQNTRFVLEILKDAWEQNDDKFDFDAAAKSKGLEVALL